MEKTRALKGKRYIALARCSSPGQADTSLDEQLRLIENFGGTHGMICVGKVSPEVTGSVPGARADLDALIRRKLERDDFDCVVIQDATRLTRSGPAHGLHIIYELRALGVNVLFVNGNLPEGEMGDVMQSMQFYAAKQQAEGIAFAATRGASASLYADKTAHCKAPPYGIDRLYCTEDGQPKHIIRNLPDGTQAKLDHQTNAVLETFGRSAKTGVPAHYIKQKSERIVLVPGDPEHVRIVQNIFERHLHNGWGYARIARDLNDRGILSPRGKQWSIATVRGILFNAIYLGNGLANVFTSAIYYLRGPDGPISSSIEPADLAKNRPPLRARPQSDWFKRPEPALSNLLDSGLKPAASAKQQVRLEALAAGLPAKRNRDRHRDSRYILKGILTTRQGGYAMSGRTTGGKNARTRYYAVSRAYSCPTTEDKVLRSLIPAEPIEQAVILALQEVLSDCEPVHKLLCEIAERELRVDRSLGSDLDTLHREKSSIEQKLAFALDELDSIGRPALQAKMSQLQSRLKVVDSEIRRHTQNHKPLECPDTIADTICEKLSDLAATVPSLPPTALRSLLENFVTNLVVDLETKAFEIEFALPEWATVAPERLCLVGCSTCKTTNEAHYVLARFEGCMRKKGRVYEFGLRPAPQRGNKLSA